jgi:peptidyl-prolyl cis-trans isomerase B (cyclophilin B)
MKNIVSIILLGLVLYACGPGADKDYIVTIKTPKGDMKVILYEETPVHKENFIKLARKGAYDSTQWHRIIEGFMVQGGDIYQDKEEKEQEKDRLPAEINDKFLHTKGSLGAARQGDQVNPEKKSSSCQFYIVDGKIFDKKELTVDQFQLNQSLSELLQKPEYDTLMQKFVALQQAGDVQAMNQLALNYVDLVEDEMGVSLTKEISDRRLEAYTTQGGAPHLDGAYTVFGRVVEGMEVIDQLAAVKTNRFDRPETPIHLVMEVNTMPKSEITEKYGYEYPIE